MVYRPALSDDKQAPTSQWGQRVRLALGIAMMNIVAWPQAADALDAYLAPSPPLPL